MTRTCICGHSAQLCVKRLYVCALNKFVSTGPVVVRLAGMANERERETAVRRVD